MMALPIGDSGSHFSQPAVDNLFNGVKWIQSISPSRQRAMERWNWELGTWQAAPLWYLPQCHCSPPLTNKNGGLQPNFKTLKQRREARARDQMRCGYRCVCCVLCATWMNTTWWVYCIYIFHTQYTCSKDRQSATAKETVALRTQLKLHFQQRTVKTAHSTSGSCERPPEAVELAASGYEVHVKAAQQGQRARGPVGHRDRLIASRDRQDGGPLVCFGHVFGAVFGLSLGCFAAVLQLFLQLAVRSSHLAMGDDGDWANERHG